jgi:hypothetical protein
VGVRRKRGNRKPESVPDLRAQVSATHMTSVNGLCVTCHEGSDGQLSAGSGWINCGGSACLVPETRRLWLRRQPSPTIAGPKYGFGIVEAIHANIRNADQLEAAATKTSATFLLKAKRMAVTNTQNTPLFRKSRRPRRMTDRFVLAARDLRALAG